MRRLGGPASLARHECRASVEHVRVRLQPAHGLVHDTSLLARLLLRLKLSQRPRLGLAILGKPLCHELAQRLAHLHAAVPVLNVDGPA